MSYLQPWSKALSIWRKEKKNFKSDRGTGSRLRGLESLEDRHMLTTFIVDTNLDEAFGGGTLAAEAADGGGLSLREAIGLANANAGATDGEIEGDTIEFALTAGNEAITLTLNTDLTINDDIAINGTNNATSANATSPNNGNVGSGVAVTIDGNNASNRFVINILAANVVNAVDDVTFQNLTFQNFTEIAGNRGAAIRAITDGSVLGFDSTVFIRDVNFLNNTSGAGGAISAESQNATAAVELIINGATFTGNTALDGNFQNNSGSGGAIILGDQLGGVATDAIITDATFTGNDAQGDNNEAGGGAIYVDVATSLTITDESGNVVIGGDTVGEANTAQNGGGIFSAGTLTILDSFSTPNFIAIGGNMAARAGGGIEVFDGMTTIIASLIGGRFFAGTTGNTAGVNGGGIHTTGGDLAISGDGEIPSSILIQNNTAIEEGGGLWINAGTTLTIIDAGGVIISGNDAQGDAAPGAGGADVQGGGGIFNNGGTVTINDTTADDVFIIENDATGATNGSGGGILSTDGTVNITGALISGNTAIRAGGGIEVVDGTMNLNDVTLGGPSVFDGNAVGSSPGNGGGLHVTGSATTNIIGGTVQNNTAASEGGGLWNSATGTMTVTGTLIDSNTASGDDADNGGGGIFNDGGTLTVNGGATISNNMADGTSGSGGGILSTDGMVRVGGGSSVNNNHANRAGGGVEVIDGTFRLQNSSLNFNDAGNGAANPGNGGGLHVSGTSGTDTRIKNSQVIGNEAASEGGGLWNQAGSIMQVVRSNVQDNTASGDDADNGGGGIFNNGGTLIVSESTIHSNDADGASGSGGGIFSTDGSVRVIDGSSITENQANRAGGGVEVIDGGFRIFDSALNNNVAGNGAANPGNGGGLHVSGNGGTDTRVVNSEVIGNEAASEGGGLWNQEGSSLIVIGSDVSGNTASGDDADNGGGGIFNNGGDVRVNSSTINNNIADGVSGSGGGIFSTGGIVAVKIGSSVNGNTAIRAGGGVEIVDGIFRLRDSTLNFNVAGNNAGNPGNGGGLHVTGTSGTDTRVINSEVIGNIAANEGGGLWNQEGSFLRVFDSLLQDNLAFGNGGGGIFNNGGELFVLRSLLFENEAVADDLGNGGGISNVNGGEGRLQDSRVIENEAEENGGGLYNDAIFEIIGSEFDDNDADDGDDIFTDVNGITTIDDASDIDDDADGPGVNID